MPTTLYTLDVDHYAPAIAALTFPLIQRYATKIGARVEVITTRRYPAWPAAYEKLQIFDLARARGDDWAFYVDLDTLIHPDCFNPIDHLAMDTVCHHGIDMAGERWRYDEYFWRAPQKHVGCCNWFTIASRWCLDLWHPLEDLTREQALGRIFPVEAERRAGIDAAHLLDDYVLSRNVARYGLQVTTMQQIYARLGYSQPAFLWHDYLLTTDEKVTKMREVLTNWKL